MLLGNEKKIPTLFEKKQTIKQLKSSCQFCTIILLLCYFVTNK